MKEFSASILALTMASKPSWLNTPSGTMRAALLTHPGSNPPSSCFTVSEDAPKVRSSTFQRIRQCFRSPKKLVEYYNIVTLNTVMIYSEITYQRGN